MIIVQARGGLGNLLFQYAAGRNLAIKNNTTLLLDFEHHYNLRDTKSNTASSIMNFMNLKCESNLSTKHSLYKVIRNKIIHYIFLKNNLIIPITNTHNINLYKESDHAFDNGVLQVKDNTKISGYFQSPKYFIHISDLIRKELIINDSLFGQLYTALKNEIRQNNSVSVHVRRGDYLKTQLYNVCNYVYYQKAMNYLSKSTENLVFYIFSDDIKWCKKKFIANNIRFVELENSLKNVLIDFSLMSHCKHNIISNSTYSWWAAWLNQNNNKHVVMPSKWSNDPKSNTHLMNQLALGDWHQIDPN